MRLCDLDEIKIQVKRQYKAQTNADRIRAMSDEELCEFLGEYKFCDILRYM